MSLKSTAANTVDIINQIFRGEKIDAILGDSSSFAYAYEWNELTKWNIPIDKLPKESIIYNRKYSFYEMYKLEVIVGIAVIVGYTILLIMLLFSNRSKRRNEKNLIQQNVEYEKLNLKFKEQNELLQIEKLKSEEGRNLLDTLINTIPDLIWLKDVNGVYLICNHRFEEFMGSKKESVIGNTFYD